MELVIGKNIQKLVNLPKLRVIGLNAKALLIIAKIRELSMDWRDSFFYSPVLDSAMLKSRFFMFIIDIVMSVSMIDWS